MTRHATINVGSFQQEGSVDTTSWPPFTGIDTSSMDTFSKSFKTVKKTTKTRVSFGWFVPRRSEEVLE